jgi:hypothetical protein
MELTMDGEFNQSSFPNINTKNNQWNIAAIHAIWERGLEQDMCASSGSEEKR